MMLGVISLVSCKHTHKYRVVRSLETNAVSGMQIHRYYDVGDTAIIEIDCYEVRKYIVLE